MRHLRRRRCGPAASNFYATAFALLPPVIAIALALITKEVYSSLFIGILVGGLLYSNFSFEGTVLHVFEDGIASVLSDSYNVGILIFLVILGSMVCLMNKAGGSAAFGRWASENIKSRVGAQLAAILLDNAIKYCDAGGKIQVRLYQRRHPILTVENTYAEVDSLELERLFNRFYRADRVRTFSGSFGVGLSIAQSIVKSHRGTITAYKKEGLIGFRVNLK